MIDEADRPDDGPDDDIGDLAWLTVRLERLAGRLRDQRYPLARFLRDPDLLPEDVDPAECATPATLEAALRRQYHRQRFEDDDLTDLDDLSDRFTEQPTAQPTALPDGPLAGWPWSGEVRSAVLRQAAVLQAANDLIAWGWADVRDSDPDHPDVHPPGNWAICEALPRRYQHTYDATFLDDFVVTAIKVAGDLASPGIHWPACTAEELALGFIHEHAVELWGALGLGGEWIDLDAMGLMDTDFQLLFMDEMDGIEDDTTFLADFTSTIGPPATWFTPFHNSAPVHPYTLTPKEPDLRDMLTIPSSPWDDRDDPTGDAKRALYALLEDPTVVDALTPLGILHHPDDITVAGARVELVTQGDWWVPDDTDRAGSLERLTHLMSRNSGMCWVAWQPADGAATPSNRSLTCARIDTGYPGRATGTCPG